MTVQTIPTHRAAAARRTAADPAQSASERLSPGSEAARDAGCICPEPRLRDGESWIALGCRVHTLRAWRDE